MIIWVGFHGKVREIYFRFVVVMVEVSAKKYFFPFTYFVLTDP